MGILDIIVPYEKIARQEFSTTLVLTRGIRCQIKKWGGDTYDISNLLEEIGLKSPIELSVHKWSRKQMCFNASDGYKSVGVYLTSGKTVAIRTYGEKIEIWHTYCLARKAIDWWTLTGMKAKFYTGASVEVIYSQKSNGLMINMVDKDENRKCLSIEYKKYSGNERYKIEDIILKLSEKFSVDDAERRILKKIHMNVEKVIEE